MYLERKPFARMRMRRPGLKSNREEPTAKLWQTYNFWYLCVMWLCHLFAEMFLACYWPIQCLIAICMCSLTHSLAVSASHSLHHSFNKYRLHLFRDLQCGDTNYWLNILSHLSSELINSLIRDIMFIYTANTYTLTNKKTVAFALSALGW